VLLYNTCKKNERHGHASSWTPNSPTILLISFQAYAGETFLKEHAWRGKSLPLRPLPIKPLKCFAMLSKLWVGMGLRFAEHGFRVGFRV